MKLVSHEATLFTNNSVSDSGDQDLLRVIRDLVWSSWELMSI